MKATLSRQESGLRAICCLHFSKYHIGARWRITYFGLCCEEFHGWAGKYTIPAPHSSMCPALSAPAPEHALWKNGRLISSNVHMSMRWDINAASPNINESNPRVSPDQRPCERALYQFHLLLFKSKTSCHAYGQAQTAIYYTSDIQMNLGSVREGEVQRCSLVRIHVLLRVLVRIDKISFDCAYWAQRKDKPDPPFPNPSPSLLSSCCGSALTGISIQYDYNETREGINEGPNTAARWVVNSFPSSPWVFWQSEGNWGEWEGKREGEGGREGARDTSRRVNVCYF